MQFLHAVAAFFAGLIAAFLPAHSSAPAVQPLPTAQENPTSLVTQQNENAFLTFQSPQSGAVLNVSHVQTIRWTLSPIISQTFPRDTTYIVLHLLKENGDKLTQNGAQMEGSIGDGTTIDRTSASWDIASAMNSKFYSLEPGVRYKIRATLSYEPRKYTCNPAVKGECDPVYSTADQALRNQAKQYVAESGYFTVVMGNYVHPEATVDQSSILINDFNRSIRGTANVDTLMLQIMPEGKPTVSVTVPVVNGKWSYTPNLPSGTYSINIWKTDGNTSLGGTSMTISAAASGISVPGMNKYTDADFGFSFWYPSGWTVTANATTNSRDWYGDGTVVKELVIAGEGKRITIDEFKSNGLSITEFGATRSASPIGVDHTYWFDKNAHLWMYTVLNSNGGAGNENLPYTKPADVSNNTMGGLHIFPGAARFGDDQIVPLSARNFLVVWEGYETGGKTYVPLLNTITATDPSVATPWSMSDQVKIIQAAKNAYAARAEGGFAAYPASGNSPLHVSFTYPFSQDREAPRINFGDGAESQLLTCTRAGCSIEHTYQPTEPFYPQKTTVFTATLGSSGGILGRVDITVTRQ